MPIEFDQTFQLDQSHPKISLERKNIDTLFFKKLVNIGNYWLILRVNNGAKGVEDSRGLRRIQPRGEAPSTDPSETEGIGDTRGPIIDPKNKSRIPNIDPIFDE